MAMDAEVERHRRNWIGFAKFLRWGTTIVVFILIMLAIFVA
jgi:hypothetical protein